MTKPVAAPFVVPVDDEHAQMMTYARSCEGRDRVLRAQQEIDAGNGIVADDDYFKSLKARRAARRASKPGENA